MGACRSRSLLGWNSLLLHTEVAVHSRSEVHNEYFVLVLSFFHRVNFHTQLTVERSTQYSNIVYEVLFLFVGQAGRGSRWGVHDNRTRSSEPCSSVSLNYQKTTATVKQPYCIVTLHLLGSSIKQDVVLPNADGATTFPTIH